MATTTDHGPSHGTHAHAGRRLMRIGTMAETLGVSARTLRYWEDLRLLPPADRTEGGYRLYDHEHVQAARGIQRLKEAGFALADIVAMQAGFRGQDTAHAGMTLLSERLAARERELQAVIRRHQELVAELGTLRGCLAHCDGCGGKRFDAACVACLSECSGRALPEPLDSLFASASGRSTP